MNITEGRRNDFIKLMNRIAYKHGCLIDFEMRPDDLDFMRIHIGKTLRNRQEFTISFGNAPSLTDLGVSIWASYFEGLNSTMNDDVATYCAADVTTTKHLYYGLSLTIKDVIFNPPATIVFWEDGTKTVVKDQDEGYDPEKGLAMAVSKKAFGGKGNYYNEFKKWLDLYYTKMEAVKPIYPSIPGFFPLSEEVKKAFTTLIDRRIASLKGETNDET